MQVTGAGISGGGSTNSNGDVPVGGAMGPTHLVALYVTTAGLQGSSLGTDEEEITLLVYVLIDALQNKVMGRQQYVVKPMAMDDEHVLNNNNNNNNNTSSCSSGSDNPAVAGSSGVVSESALELAPTLTEQYLREHGIPIQQAIQQFETWYQSLTCVATGSAPRFVVDGQAPLRQCLHPEACKKQFDLPEHYNAFYDLRKEFSKCYSTNDELSLISIQEMLQYFNMPPDTDNDYHVKEVQDMIAVMQRMIKDGHVFENPEAIKLLLEPGICSKDEKVDSNCVVRARGLPWQSSDQDVAKFFRGLNLEKGGVALCLSMQGRRNGEALVRFVSKEHRDMALKRHKHHINTRYIEVYKSSGEDFVAVAGGTNGEAHAFLSRGAQVIVRMRGLPYDCTAKQVLEFFASGQKPCQVQDGEDGVLFVKKADGRATGDAFVLFAKEEDAAKALSKHRDCIGSRYIELFRSTTAEVQQVLNRVSDIKPFERALLPAIQAMPLPQRYITLGTRKDCVRLRGLPYEALVEHILEFMGEHSKNIEYKGVHMVYNAQGQPSGEAFIQMISEAAAFACASQRHHRYMIFGKKQRYIEVFQCSGDDMNLVLTAGTPLPGKALLSPGSLTAAGAVQSPIPPAQAQVAVPVPAPQPTAQLWDIHALMQAQAQAQAAHAQAAHAQAAHAQAAQAQAAHAQVQAQAAQAQAAQAQALRQQDLWLMALASNGANPGVSPGSPTGPSKALALPSTVPQHNQPHPQPHPHPHQAQLHPAYASQEQFHAQAMAAQHAALGGPNGPLIFFNMPQHRIPLMRAHAPPGFMTPPLIPGAPINPTALLGLGKRSWDSSFPAETAASAPKRAAWQTPAAAFHATAQTAPPTLAYPAQFFPQM